MPQYMLSVFGDEAEFARQQQNAELIQQIYADVGKVNDRLQEQGAWVFGGGLHPTSTATVVRVNDGDAPTTDGPYIEAKEQLGGFWVIDQLTWTPRSRGPRTALLRARTRSRSAPSRKSQKPERRPAVPTLGHRRSRTCISCRVRTRSSNPGPSLR